MAFTDVFLRFAVDISLTVNNLQTVACYADTTFDVVFALVDRTVDNVAEISCMNISVVVNNPVVDNRLATKLPT